MTAFAAARTIVRRYIDTTKWSVDIFASPAEPPRLVFSSERPKMRRASVFGRVVLKTITEATADAAWASVPAGMSVHALLFPAGRHPRRHHYRPLQGRLARNTISEVRREVEMPIPRTHSFRIKRSKSKITSNLFLVNEQDCREGK